MKRTFATVVILMALLSFLSACTKTPARQLKEMGYEVTPQTFLECVQKGDLTAVGLFLTAKMSPDTKHEEGLTALMLATIAGNPDMVKLLTESKADVNAKSKRDYWTAFQFATANGHIEVANHLLQQGASVDPKWFASHSVIRAFHAAVKAGKVEDAKWYIRQGAHPDAVFDDVSDPLIVVAARNSDLATVAMLLEEGANPDASFMDSALIVASVCGNVELTELLLNNGANPDIHSEQTTPLHFATGENHLRIVELLLKHGAFVDPIGHYGETPLITASYSGHLEIVKVLLSHGASVNVSTTWYFNDGHRLITPLSGAEMNGHNEVAKLLRDEGAK